MRHAIAILSAVALLGASPAFAEAGSMLPAGKPAGVKQAQSETSRLVLIGLGVGLAGLAIAAIASNGKAGGPNTATNTAPGAAP